MRKRYTQLPLVLRTKYFSFTKTTQFWNVCEFIICILLYVTQQQYSCLAVSRFDHEVGLSLYAMTGVPYQVNVSLFLFSSSSRLHVALPLTTVSSGVWFISSLVDGRGMWSKCYIAPQIALRLLPYQPEVTLSLHSPLWPTVSTEVTLSLHSPLWPTVSTELTLSLHSPLWPTVSTRIYYFPQLAVRPTVSTRGYFILPFAVWLNLSI